MKKVKLISIIICAVTIISVLAIASNAKWWDENPFTDVKSSHWYYDAVRITNENGIFNGTSETKFTPSGKMTRAMLVQALAAADGFDKADYTEGTPFTDVKASHWFAPAVEWAYKNNITSGKTADKFAPNEYITREQLASMLYRYASYKGIEITNTKDFSSFPDASKVASYAKDSFEWAYGNGIINGSKKGDELFLNPRNTATRAECATMFSQYLYLNPVYEINGNDLSLYTIVYPENEVESVKKAANDLAKFIRQSIDIDLPVVTDAAEATEYEILVGKTNRETEGLVTVDRSDLGDMEFFCTLQGNRLIVTGIDDDAETLNKNGDRSHHSIKGSLNAAYWLLREEFGVEFYYDGEGTVAEPDPVISFEAPYYRRDDQDFESVSLYIASEGGKDCYLQNTYYSEYGCGLPHQIVNIITGKWKEGFTGDHTAANICYSDPDNMEAALTNTRELLESRPTLNMVGLLQTDSDAYCRCERCAELYREHGCRAATIIGIVNYVAENLEADYPDVWFASAAYNWSSKPPKTDLGYRENVLLYHAPITLCPCHEYTDETCKFNGSFPDEIKAWQGRAGKFYVWDYSGSFGDAMVPAQDLDSIRSNVAAFYESGVRGVFLNSRASGKPSDLYGLRAYLFTSLYRDAEMSEEEYYYRMNGYLKTYFGDGWSYIRQYIDSICEISNQMCTGTHAEITGMYDFDLVVAAGDEINALWDKAEAASANEEDLERVKLHRLSWTYLWQSARYESEYTNGTDAQREAYTEISRKLSEDIVKYGVKWEGKGEQPSGDLTVPPYQW